MSKKNKAIRIIVGLIGYVVAMVNYTQALLTRSYYSSPEAFFVQQYCIIILLIVPTILPLAWESRQKPFAKLVLLSVGLSTIGMSFYLVFLVIKKLIMLFYQM